MATTNDLLGGSALSSGNGVQGGVTEHQVAGSQVADNLGVESIAETSQASNGNSISDSALAGGERTLTSPSEEQGDKGEDSSDIETIPAVDEERTFTLFPKLAPGLRLYIWKGALPTSPRYIEVHSEHPPYCTDDTAYTWYYTSSDNVPLVISLANREARSVVLSHYAVLPSRTPGRAAAYFEAAVDILAFRYTANDMVYEFWKWVSDSSDAFLGSIKYMALQCWRPVEGANGLVFGVADFFSQAHVNRLTGLEMVQVCRWTDRDVCRWSDQDEPKRVEVDGKLVDLWDRGTIVGFLEDAEVTKGADFEHELFQHDFRRAMTTIGQDWDAEPIEAVRDGWVAPKAVFGDFIIEG